MPRVIGACVCTSASYAGCGQAAAPALLASDRAVLLSLTSLPPIAALPLLGVADGNQATEESGDRDCAYTLQRPLAGCRLGRRPATRSLPGPIRRSPHGYSTQRGPPSSMHWCASSTAAAAAALAPATFAANLAAVLLLLLRS